MSHRRLNRISRRCVLVVVIGQAFVVGYLIGFAPVPFSAARISAVSGGEKTLDAMFAYSPSEGAAALAALGSEGRRHYNYLQIADLAFPLSYAAALSSAIFAWFHKRWALALACVPIVAAAFDYLENAAVFVALRTYPNPSRAALLGASAAGVVKWISFVLALVLCAGGGLYRLARVVRAQSVGEQH